MRKISLFAGALAFAALTTTFAFADDVKPGPKVREACKSDVEKFCGSVEHGKGKIRGCLQEHMTDLQEACSAAIKARAAQ